jgi:hypothetical protein
MEGASLQPHLTCHARRRGQQRGASWGAIDLVYQYGDCDLPAGSGCVCRVLSRRALPELVADGWRPALIDRAARLTLVVAGDGALVTLWSHHAGACRPRPRLHVRRSVRR